MANMTFKASLLPSTDLGYSLGSSTQKWKINDLTGGPIEYIVGTQTAATGSWTGVTKDSALATGKVIAYKLPYAGSGNASLTLTFTNPTGDANSGAIPVYLNNTRVTTHYAANSVILMVYDGTNWRSTDYWNANSRDAGYGKISITQSTATTGLTTNTTQLVATTYTETMTVAAGNKWVQLAGTNGNAGADILKIGHSLSGAAAGNYGDSTNQTPAYGGTFNVPYISVDAAGHITTISTHTVKIPAGYSLPTASTSTKGGIKVGTGLTMSSETLNHSNSVTAQATQALYPIKIDAQGHISGYGTAVTSLPASDVSAWAKAATKPTYNWGEISQSGANNIEEGTSDFTDNSEIFSSYASNNGFADTNAPGKVYRRDAVHMYNYVKTKLAITNNNISVGWNTETTVATIGGTAIKVKIPANPNTWRGIQNNLTSTRTTDSLSANQGRLLANGSARDSTKVAKSGDTMTGNLTMSANTYVQKAGSSVSWYQGRDAAVIKTTSYSGYDSIYSLKTTDGDWSCGVYTGNKLYWTYITDSNHDSNVNTVSAQMRLESNGYLYTTKTYGAVWNDYAEMRNVPEAQKEDSTLKPGMCVHEVGDGTMVISANRLERGCKIISDTFGFNIGETEECKTPIAVSGRALVYINEGRKIASSHIGWPVCSGPNGTVSIMTEEEEEKYPSRIVGTISEIPTYEEWGTGKVKVNGRIWIYVK